MNTIYNKNRGFTLIEVAVSLILIGMFIAVFGPAISDIFKQSMNVSDNNESFNLAYNYASYEANNAQDEVTTENIDKVNVDIFEKSSGEIVLTLDDGSGAPLTTYSPEKFLVYTSEYSSGRFGSSKTLRFNDYSIR